MTAIPMPFNNGLSTGADHMTCPPGFLLTMDDYQIDYGVLRTRYGQTAINSTVIASSGDEVNGIYFYNDLAAASSGNNGATVIVNVGGKFWRALYTNDSTWEVASNVAFTDITGATTPATYPTFADTLNGIMAITGVSATGASKITSASSNAAVLGGTPPVAPRMVKVVNNFMFLGVTFITGGDGNNGSRVYYSNVGDPETWGAANYFDYITNDGDYVTSLGQLGQDLIIFKHNSIGRLSTQTVSISGSVSLGPLYTIFKGIGCPAPGLVDSMPDGTLAFLGCDYNLYLTDGVSLKMISKDKFPGVDVSRGGMGATIPIGPSLIGNTTTLKVYPTRNEIWITCLISPLANVKKTQIFAYDYVQNYWRRISGLNLRCLTIIPPYRATAGSATPELTTLPYVMLGGEIGSITGANVVPNIYFLDNPLQTTVKDIRGNTVVANATFSVPLPTEFQDFPFRSLIIPSANSGSTSVYFGFDGTLNGSATATLNSSFVRNAIPIPHKGAASLRASSMQVKLTDSLATNKVYMPYLSGEVLT